ncbi:hypothetical protein H4R34_002085 [Dimargaris verticillata]|uniref:Velvet domain-containing protein n=1 Tax=Dimargaris verticillata TaxID=2761393 RepID=A0A9W8B8R4_9FUNG|nr:hypothetical protein H4R34_002085 [Dimargaris verticillata]
MSRSVDDVFSYHFTDVVQNSKQREHIEYELIIRQEVVKGRTCGVGPKADRRPINPEPIIQLLVHDKSEANVTPFQHSPYYFMFATLTTEDGSREIHILSDFHTHVIRGSVVSSIYYAKDNHNREGAFFVFPDISVRVEGTYRLKFSLFEIVGNVVYFCKSVLSSPFTVFSAKKFPGMDPSTTLSQTFAKQGLKVRMRSENRRKKITVKGEKKDSDDSPTGTTPTPPSGHLSDPPSTYMTRFALANRRAADILPSDRSASDPTSTASGSAYYPPARQGPRQSSHLSGHPYPFDPKHPLPDSYGRPRTSPVYPTQPPGSHLSPHLPPIPPLGHPSGYAQHPPGCQPVQYMRETPPGPPPSTHHGHYPLPMPASRKAADQQPPKAVKRARPSSFDESHPASTGSALPGIPPMASRISVHSLLDQPDRAPTEGMATPAYNMAHPKSQLPRATHGSQARPVAPLHLSLESPSTSSHPVYRDHPGQGSRPWSTLSNVDSGHPSQQYDALERRQLYGSNQPSPTYPPPALARGPYSSPNMGSQASRPRSPEPVRRHSGIHGSIAPPSAVERLYTGWRREEPLPAYPLPGSTASPSGLQSGVRSLALGSSPYIPSTVAQSYSSMRPGSEDFMSPSCPTTPVQSRPLPLGASSSLDPCLPPASYDSQAPFPTPRPSFSHDHFLDRKTSITTRPSQAHYPVEPRRTVSDHTAGAASTGSSRNMHHLSSSSSAEQASRLPPISHLSAVSEGSCGAGPRSHVVSSDHRSPQTGSLGRDPYYSFGQGSGSPLTTPPMGSSGPNLTLPPTPSNSGAQQGPAQASSYPLAGPRSYR